MRRDIAWSLRALALVAAAVLVVLWQGTQPGAGAPPGRVSTQDTEQLLRGTWLREYRERGVKVRRLLSLEAGGAFHETVRVEREGRVTQFLHEGTWLFDGTNLKRKYTRTNGEPVSRLNMPFATFEIAFVSHNEFTGVDHIHGNRIDYVRVDYGSLTDD